MLEVSALSKHYGGVKATDQVNLNVKAGECHAIIGPNGAGKTTLIGQLCGELLSDAGVIFFQGRNVTGLPMHRRVQLGLARSFQITSVFDDMTVLANVAVAVQANRGHSFRFWRPVSRNESINARALEVLRLVGMEVQQHQPAGALSHGERRQLEIAMALATEPQLLLLDEPMAGMGAEESNAMLAMLQALKGDITLLLVEHDMDVVFSLADTISVLVYGQVIETGSPAQIRNSATVREAYLGDAG